MVNCAYCMFHTSEIIEEIYLFLYEFQVKAVFFLFKCWHWEIRDICNGGFHSDRGKPLLDAFTFIGSSVFP